MVQLQKRKNRVMKKDLRARPNIFVENHYKDCSARFKQDLGQMANDSKKSNTYNRGNLFVDNTIISPLSSPPPYTPIQC